MHFNARKHVALSIEIQVSLKRSRNFDTSKRTYTSDKPKGSKSTQESSKTSRERAITNQKKLQKHARAVKKEIILLTSHANLCWEVGKAEK